uniref:Uncharacterized protein n=1 Tax=Physcomitrium patens TaxID=3218 RepID=A0A2K1JMN0_PHYPA|nr:uncharacterized protein LOC112290495 [Physcomitrium patens]PNR42804.1 hypothetical protein PHYPA_017635 [Physcomitrium patens]|eukprot:XP_024392546.1 uncharacterized protein LOC112290495 [Physcomitrella patens]
MEILKYLLSVHQRLHNPQLSGLDCSYVPNWKCLCQRSFLNNHFFADHVANIKMESGEMHQQIPSGAPFDCWVLFSEVEDGEAWIENLDIRPMFGNQRFSDRQLQSSSSGEGALAAK